MKNNLRGTRFDTEEEVIESVEQYFGSKSSEFYQRGVDQLREKYEKVIELEGHYVCD